jgi:hypothetical protein
MAKKYGKRSRYGNRYVARNAKGRFISNVDVGRSLKADRRRDAKNYAGPGFGQMGDASSKKKGMFRTEMPVPQNYPEGDGRILGQSDSTTNYTPAGLHAETFFGGAKQGFGVTMGVLGALVVGGFAMNMLGMASGDASDE